MNRLKIYTNEINQKILEFFGFESPKIIIEGTYNWKFARSHYAFEHYNKYRKLRSPVVLEVETNLNKSLKSEYFMHRVFKILARRFFEQQARLCNKASEFFNAVAYLLGIDKTEINEESLKASFNYNFQTEAFSKYKLDINNEENEILCKIFSQDTSPQIWNGSNYGTPLGKNETQCKKKSLCQQISNPKQIGLLF